MTENGNGDGDGSVPVLPIKRRTQSLSALPKEVDAPKSPKKVTNRRRSNQIANRDRTESASDCASQDGNWRSETGAAQCVIN